MDKWLHEWESFLLHTINRLSSLLNSRNNGQGNMDIITQSFRDISSMSTKSLDQLDRTGAFHH